MTPEVFAQQLVDDFGVMQASLFKGEIAEQIRKQVAEYAMAVEDDPTGTGETRVVDEEGIEHEDIRIVIKVFFLACLLIIVAILMQTRPKSSI